MCRFSRMYEMMFFSTPIGIIKDDKVDTPQNVRFPKIFDELDGLKVRGR
jgi:hypothetical protein